MKTARLTQAAWYEEHQVTQQQNNISNERGQSDLNVS